MILTILNVLIIKNKCIHSLGKKFVKEITLFFVQFNNDHSTVFI